MAESSTGTSKPSWLVRLYRAPYFWGIVAMFNDLTLSFFHPKVMPMGPGWILGLAGGIFASAFRNPETGEYRRTQAQLSPWLILIPFALVVCLRLYKVFRHDEDSETALTLAQCGVAFVCCWLTMARFRKIPVESHV